MFQSEVSPSLKKFELISAPLLKDLWVTEISMMDEGIEDTILIAVKMIQTKFWNNLKCMGVL